MTTTPNMNLPVAVPGTTPGPTWADQIVADMNTIDAHDHSAGKGVPITPDGLNINSDLSVGGNSVTDAGAVTFQAQSAALSTLITTYVVGADLYYTDGAGNQVRITQSGSVTGSTGTITGLPSGTASASFSGGTFTFESATSTPATMAVGPVEIGRAAASSKTVTLTPDAAQAANFDMTFPASLPASTYPISVSSAGNMDVSGTVQLAAGSAASPALYLSGDSNTGLFQSAADEIAVSTGGTQRLKVSSTALTTTNPIVLPQGSQAAPSITFSGDTNTGIYSDGSDDVAIVTGGTRKLDVGSVSVVALVPFRGSAGSSSSPSISFNGDADTGFYSKGTNSIDVTCGSSDSGSFDSAKWTMPGAVIQGDATVSGMADITGALAAASLNLSSGGVFKATTYTGSATPGSTTILTPSGTPFGAVGYDDTGKTFASIFGSTASNTFQFTSGSFGEIRFVNNYSGTHSYRVIVFHS